MSEQSGENDIALQLNNQRDNYESQIQKLQSRVDRQTTKKEELKTLVTTLASVVEQLDYERGQYSDKITEVTEEADTLDNQV